MPGNPGPKERWFTAEPTPRDQIETEPILLEPIYAKKTPPHGILCGGVFCVKKEGDVTGNQGLGEVCKKQREFFGSAWQGNQYRGNAIALQMTLTAQKRMAGRTDCLTTLLRS